MSPDIANNVIWVLWVLSWIVAAVWADRAVKRAALADQLLFRVVIGVGGVLLFAKFDGVFHLGRRHWDFGGVGDWGLVAVSVLGFGFAWWARLHLGALWSGSVTKKAEHRVVDTGPYAIVRHPIYTGLIAAIFATAALKGAPVRVLGALLMTLGFWIKARLEERFLREQLGPDAYDSYRRRVPMLAPFGPLSR